MTRRPAGEMPLVFVSPHLDDVALSCAAKLLHAERRCVVMSVFTEGKGYAKRRREDRDALASIGVEAVHLGLRDAPFRLGCGFDEVVQSPSDEDVEAVREALRIDGAHEVWFPAGVGGHVDHLAVARAAPEGARFYLERPYAFGEQLPPHERVTYPAGTFERVVALIDAYRSQTPWLFDARSCRAAYARHATDGGTFFELVGVPS